MDSSESNTFVMYTAAAAADSIVLPLYIIYKVENLTSLVMVLQAQVYWYCIKPVKKWLVDNGNI